MKILLAAVDLSNKKENPYVRTLVDAINAKHSDIIWGDGLNAFWSDKCFDYDIIHIQWPHGLLGNATLKKYNANMLEARLYELKQRGIRIVSTCHNIEPHYSSSEDSIRAYDIVYSASDCILHLGRYSMELFKKKYTKARHEFLLHHVYDQLYHEAPDLESCARHLKLSTNYKYVLCFGNFRANEERRMIAVLSKRLAKDGIRILAPSFCRIPTRRNPVPVIRKAIQFAYYKIRYPNIYMSKYYVDDEELGYYFGISSLCLIQRLKILNSGGVSLGFYMKKCVVGPDCGNVGPWLKETGNPVFVPGDSNSVYEAVNDGLKNIGQGERNYQYALSHLTSEHIGDSLYQIYQIVCQE